MAALNQPPSVVVHEHARIAVRPGSPVQPPGTAGMETDRTDARRADAPSPRWPRSPPSRPRVARTAAQRLKPRATDIRSRIPEMDASRSMGPKTLHKGLPDAGPWTDIPKAYRISNAQPKRTTSLRRS